MPPRRETKQYEGSYCRSRFIMESMDHLRRENLAEAEFQRAKETYKTHSATRKVLAPEAEDSLQPEVQEVESQPKRVKLESAEMEKQQQLREIELEMNENEEVGRTAQHRILVAEDRWKEGMRDLMNATWKRKELEKRKAALQEAGN